MLGRVSSYLMTGANFFMRTGDLLISSRMTWLATGTLTAWNWGAFRKATIQDDALQVGDVIEHTREECLTYRCAQQIWDLEHVYDSGFNGYLEVAPNCTEGAACQTHFVVRRAHASQHFSKTTHQFAQWTPISLLDRCRPTSMDLIVGGAYFAFILTVASAGGRLPLHGNLLRYVAAQTATKMLDAVVISSFVILKIEPSRWNARARSLEWVPDSRNWKRCSTPALMVALSYFALRISDGWLMAKMPVNTLPFASLARRLFVRS